MYAGFIEATMHGRAGVSAVREVKWSVMRVLYAASGGSRGGRPDGWRDAMKGFFRKLVLWQNGQHGEKS